MITTPALSGRLTYGVPGALRSCLYQCTLTNPGGGGDSITPVRRPRDPKLYEEAWAVQEAAPARGCDDARPEPVQGRVPREGGGAHTRELVLERTHDSSDSQANLNQLYGGRGEEWEHPTLLVQIQRGDPRFSQEGSFFNQLP